MLSEQETQVCVPLPSFLHLSIYLSMALVNFPNEEGIPSYNSHQLTDVFSLLLRAASVYLEINGLLKYVILARSKKRLIY